jgi:hypothetical protein
MITSHRLSTKTGQFHYHCRPGCRAVNVTKAKLEGLFADELALLQPTPGYMRLLKKSVLQI